MPQPLDEHLKSQLTQGLVDIGEVIASDVVTIISPIVPSLEHRLRQAMEGLQEHKNVVTVILDTPGGVVEVVEWTVSVLRSVCGEVIVIVPDRAMSAGTILTLSADRIMMDHLSCLGPVDPQIERDGKLVPALSYLNQFERLNEKAQDGQLTKAEYALLNKLDLGGLYQFDQARELSIDLLIRWLPQYKFRNWAATETRGELVSKRMKVERARETAALLNDLEKWHSHGRATDAGAPRGEVNLRIDSFEGDAGSHRAVGEYFELLRDYMHQGDLISFVHSREYFWNERKNKDFDAARGSGFGMGAGSILTRDGLRSRQRHSAADLPAAPGGGRV